MSQFTFPAIVGTNPIGALPDQVSAAVHSVWLSQATLFNMTFWKTLNQNQTTGAVVNLRGQPTGDSEAKARGDSYGEGTVPGQEIVISSDRSEGQDLKYDMEDYGDSALAASAAATDARQFVVKEMDKADTRILRALTKAARATALSGIFSAPVSVTRPLNVTPTGLTYRSFYAYSEADGDALCDDFTLLCEKLDNQPEGPLMNRVALMPSTMFYTFNKAKQRRNRDFNPEANTMTRVRGVFQDVPILVVPDKYWPRANITTDKRTRYNVNASFNVAVDTGSTGAPGMFIMDYSPDESPLAKVIAPSRQGIDAYMLPEDQTKETMILRRRNRYTFDTLYPNRIATLWLANSGT
jgi:hypothetical protein